MAEFNDPTGRTLGLDGGPELDGEESESMQAASKLLDAVTDKTGDSKITTVHDVITTRSELDAADSVHVPSVQPGR